MFSFCSRRLKAVEEIYWWPSGGFSHGWLILGLTSEVIFVSKSHLNGRFHTQGVSARLWRARKTIRQIGFLVLCMNWPPGWHVVDFAEKERVGVQREATEFLVTGRKFISVVRWQVTSKRAGDWWSLRSAWVFLAQYLRLLEWNAPKLEEVTETKPGLPAWLVWTSF